MNAPEPMAPQRLYFRPSSADLGDMPIDTDALTWAVASLSTLELGTWLRLKRHLWSFGELPIATKRLAAIGGVTPRRFTHMAPALAPLFDHDAHGRWRDLGLEEARNKVLELQPGERISFETAPDAANIEPAVPPSLSETRRRAGQAGARKRWDLKNRLQLLDGGKKDDLPSAPMANDSKNDMAKSDALPPFGLSSLPSDASGDASLSDRQESLEPKEKIEESDGRTDARPRGASPSPDGKNPPDGDGKTIGDGDGKTPAAGDGKPSDADVIAALRGVAGGRIPNHLLTTSGIAPVRTLIDTGCDLTRDIVPAFEACVSGLTQPLQSLKAGFIHEAARANRDEALRAKTTPATFDKVFVALDSPEWMAWCDRLKRKSFPTTETMVDGRPRRGWYFDKQWPSGADQGEYQRKAGERRG